MININIKLQRNNFLLQIRESFALGITGIFGPSGSGKTSLLSAIAGLETPEDGVIKVGDRVLFDKKNNINIPIHKRKMGYVFQEGRLFPHMTVEQNLRYGEQKGKGKIEFTEVIELLDIGHLLKSKPANISGGECQRTAIGRSLLSSPDLLLLDEPFSALDVGIREQIIPFILRIQKAIKIPILVVSHDMTDLLKLSTRLFLVEKGQCIGHGEYLDLLKNPKLKTVFRSSPAVNAINMRVVEVDANAGLTHLAIHLGDNKVKVICDHQLKYQKNDEVKIFIRSDDIALSNLYLDGITMQNQLRGVVNDTVEDNGRVLCMVDVGFMLVVEITHDSMKRLAIEKDKVVYCLFKSVAIDFIH